MAVLDAEIKQQALAAARVLSRMAPVRAAYIFGSRAEGRAHPWSDIDVALVMEGVESWDMQRRAQAMFRVQKEVGLEVEAHLFPADALVRPEQGSFAAYIIKNGFAITLTD